MLAWPKLKRPFVFGHRGASAHAPENTLEAMEEALRQGADGLEFDVKLTRDGQVVVMHDATLDRTTDGQGRVNRHTLAEIQQLNDSAHFPGGYAPTHVPTLTEVLDAFGKRTILNIELTNYTSPLDVLAWRVMKLVRQFGVEDRVLFSSFLPTNIWIVHRLMPDVFCGMLAEPNILGRWVCRGGWQRGALALHPALEMTTRDLVDATHRLGGRVHVYTVNNPDDMRRLRDWGVDAIFTDDPALARRVFVEQA